MFTPPSVPVPLEPSVLHAETTSTATEACAAIVGRDDEVARINEFVAGAFVPGGALLVGGEAGSGKSCLLRAGTRIAEGAGARVIATGGVPSESQLPFAALDRLLHPLMAHADRLSGPQRAALRTAFGIDDGAPDASSVALAALHLLREVAAAAPLLVVVDDAQWLDRASADTVGFIARRLECDPIRMLVATRDDAAEPAVDAARLHLDPLERPAAVALLAARDCTGTARHLRGRILDLAAGNPLALVDLPVTLADASRGGIAGVVPLTGRLEEAFAGSLRDLPASTRALLLLVAADEPVSESELLAAAALLEGFEPASEWLAAPEARRVLISDGARLRFAHPLTRSAVYQQASLAERRAVHAALAAVFADQPDRRVWHESAALTGPDERVCTELQSTAARAERRGDFVTALQAYRLAVECTDDPHRQGRSLAAAAELAFELGLVDEALELVAQAEERGRESADRPGCRVVRCLLGMPSADAAAVHDTVAAAVRAAAAGEDHAAAKLLLHVARTGDWCRTAPDIAETVIETSQRLHLDHDDPRVIVIQTVVAPARGGGKVIDLLGRADRLADPIDSTLLGASACAVGHLELAVGFLTAAIDGLRPQRRRALGARAFVLRAGANLHLGRIDAAHTDTNTGSWLANATGQCGWALTALAVQANLAALRGDAESVERLAAEAERAALPAGLAGIVADVQLARGLVALGSGRYDDAFDALACLVPAEMVQPGLDQGWLIGDLAEAAVYSDRGSSVGALMPRVEGLYRRMPSPRLHVALAHARALLADDEHAEALFVVGLAETPAAWPVATARLQLAYGTWLRRRRRPADARRPLRAAREAFDALGMTTWAERARLELRAAGVNVHTTLEPDRLSELTAQELQIARLAASGLSNRTIGQQLFLSHRTVSAHLYRLFPKLGVTARGQLAAVLDRATRDLAAA